MKTGLTLATALAFALAACGSQGEATTEPAEDTAALPEATDEAPDPSTPQGFVDMAASSDLYEVEAGRLAQEMGKSDAVKEFGAMMEKDHTASSDKLRAAVSEAGDGLTVPTAMLPKHQQQLDALRNAGDNFDRLYAQQQQAAHQEALNLLTSQAQAGTVASLKAFATETAPIVEGHLDHASELGESVAGTESAAGGGE
jgi:putative membrane protein